jgi:hypothetical protein
MFEIFDRILFKNKLISLYNYIVVGQVCVDKQYRAKVLLITAMPFIEII